jgi:hypothetical protein
LFYRVEVISVSLVREDEPAPVFEAPRAVARVPAPIPAPAPAPEVHDPIEFHIQAGGAAGKENATEGGEEERKKLEEEQKKKEKKAKDREYSKRYRDRKRSGMSDSPTIECTTTLFSLYILSISV